MNKKKIVAVMATVLSVIVGVVVIVSVVALSCGNGQSFSPSVWPLCFYGYTLRRKFKKGGKIK